MKMQNEYPTRKPMRHASPGKWAITSFYFVTICENRFSDVLVGDALRRVPPSSSGRVPPSSSGRVPPSSSGRVPNVAPKATLLSHVREILATARHYQEMGKWFISILLVMPDHIHMLVHPCGEVPLAQVIGAWKHYLTHVCRIDFQRDFFDTRIRDDAHYEEKWLYIVRNPVARGLVATPREWPHVIAYSRETGEELAHR